MPEPTLAVSINKKNRNPIGQSPTSSQEKPKKTYTQKQKRAYAKKKKKKLNKSEIVNDSTASQSQTTGTSSSSPKKKVNPKRKKLNKKTAPNNPSSNTTTTQSPNSTSTTLSSQTSKTQKKSKSKKQNKPPKSLKRPLFRTTRLESGLRIPPLHSWIFHPVPKPLNSKLFSRIPLRYGILPPKKHLSKMRIFHSSTIEYRLLQSCPSWQNSYSVAENDIRIYLRNRISPIEPTTKNSLSFWDKELFRPNFHRVGCKYQVSILNLPPTMTASQFKTLFPLSDSANLVKYFPGSYFDSLFHPHKTRTSSIELFDFSTICQIVKSMYFFKKKSSILVDFSNEKLYHFAQSKLSTDFYVPNRLVPANIVFQFLYYFGGLHGFGGQQRDGSDSDLNQLSSSNYFPTILKNSKSLADNTKCVYYINPTTQNKMPSRCIISFSNKSEADRCVKFFNGRIFPDQFSFLSDDETVLFGFASPSVIDGVDEPSLNHGKYPDFVSSDFIRSQIGIAWQSSCTQSIVEFPFYSIPQLLHNKMKIEKKTLMLYDTLEQSDMFKSFQAGYLTVEPPREPMCLELFQLLHNEKSDQQKMTPLVESILKMRKNGKKKSKKPKNRKKKKKIQS